MESHPQNLEFRNNPENFHLCANETDCTFSHNLSVMLNAIN